MAKPEMPNQLEEGLYPVTLMKIIDEDDEGRPLLRDNFNKTAKERYQDWIFKIEDGDHEGEEVRARSSLKYAAKGESNPASKAYLFAQALCGGVAPVLGTFDFQDLPGKRAMADVRTNDKGYSALHELRPRKKPAGTVKAAPPPVEDDDSVPF